MPKTENAKLSEEIDTLKAANLPLALMYLALARLSTMILKLVKYYTDFLMFMACFIFLESLAKILPTWKGSSTAPEIWELHGTKRGSKPKLSLINQFSNGSSLVRTWRSGSCSALQGIIVYSLPIHYNRVDKGRLSHKIMICLSAHNHFTFYSMYQNVAYCMCFPLVQSLFA